MANAIGFELLREGPLLLNVLPFAFPKRLIHFLGTTKADDLELGKIDASLTEIVDLKFFCGFTFAEIAAMKAISERTVQRQWEKARIYLHRKISTDLEA